MNAKQEALLSELKKLLVDMFEVDPEQVHAGANLYEDLDIDSIDAVDLLGELRKMTGKVIDPEAFKSVRTVGDVIQAVSALLEEQND